MKRVVFETNTWVGSYLRVRDEWEKITCTYKEEEIWNDSITSIKELETEIKDFNIMVNIFKKLWLEQKSYQETYREIWKINNEIEIMINLWPGLNLYVEKEWKNEYVVRKYSELLWFDYSKWIFGSSFKIYELELGIDFEKINNLEQITFNNIEEIKNLWGTVQ
jgi:hypothetical protein